MTDKKTDQEGGSPPPYTPGLDLPAYHDLPEKKVRSIASEHFLKLVLNCCVSGPKLLPASLN